MRILHLIRTPRHSGAEILVRDLCVKHQQLGVQSAIAALEPAAPSFQPEMDEIHARGIRLFVPQGQQSRMARVAKFASAYRAFRPDVILAHSILPSIYGRLALPFAAIRPPLATVLHSGSDDFAHWRLRIGERILQSLTSQIITVSPFAASFYRRRFSNPPPIECIPNGIDLARFEAARPLRALSRRKWGLNEHSKLLLQVGRVMPPKQQMMILETLVEDLHSDPRLHLWFAGVVDDTAYHNRLMELISAQHLGERLQWLGPRDDVPELLSAADVFVMPSLYESSGLAFVEGLASGVRVVASDIPTFNFARSMPGVSLVSPSNPADFRAELLPALDSGETYHRSLTDYDADLMALRYLDCSRALVTRKPSGRLGLVR